MKRTRWTSFLVAGVFSIGMFGQVHATETRVITFAVTSQGLKTTDVPIDKKRMTLPKGTRVKLVFKYADTNNNAHQFTLLSSQTEKTSATITSEGNRMAVIEFTVGERAEEFYRISCELPCIAMEALTDYIIMVGPKNGA